MLSHKLSAEESKSMSAELGRSLNALFPPHGDAMGRNMLKSDMGGGLIGTSVLFIMAGIRGGIWTRATLVLVSSYLLVRSVSAVVDGPTPLALVGITVEAAAVAALLLAVRLERAEGR